MAVYLDDFFIMLMTEIWIFCKIDIFSETISSGRTYFAIWGIKHYFRRYQKNTPLQNLESLRSLRNLLLFELEGLSFGTFFGLLCFSQTSQTSNTYSFGHLSEKRQILKASKPSASKAGRFLQTSQRFQIL